MGPKLGPTFQLQISDERIDIQLVFELSVPLQVAQWLRELFVDRPDQLSSNSNFSVHVPIVHRDYTAALLIYKNFKESTKTIFCFLEDRVQLVGLVSASKTIWKRMKDVAVSLAVKIFLKRTELSWPWLPS